MLILIVDDSRVMRHIVTRTLRQTGCGDHEFVEAGNGLAALRVISSDAPDLVFSGWNMPEMNGIELLRALRNAGDQTEFGFVTSESSPEMREIAMAAGARFLIAKPFTADAFSELMGELIS
ncbi:MAG TPA: response regulator [Candidatus Nanopelagicaceae bacterium]|nr:response regulator [Candidatus Nanopelagicaceae bacterium]